MRRAPACTFVKSASNRKRKKSKDYYQQSFVKATSQDVFNINDNDDENDSRNNQRPQRRSKQASRLAIKKLLCGEESFENVNDNEKEKDVQSDHSWTQLDHQDKHETPELSSDSSDYDECYSISNINKRSKSCLKRGRGRPKKNAELLLNNISINDNANQKISTDLTSKVLNIFETKSDPSQNRPQIAK